MNVPMRLMLIRKGVSDAAKRNFGASYVICQKSDPVQQMFLEKSREYYKKRAASPNKEWPLVDSSPAAQKSLKDEFDKITKMFGANATKEFPSLTFTDKPLEPIVPDQIDTVKLSEDFLKGGVSVVSGSSENKLSEVDARHEILFQISNLREEVYQKTGKQISAEEAARQLKVEFNGKPRVH